MSEWDGNAIAGMLHVAFGREMTNVHATCADCDAQRPLAQAEVYRGAGTVVRCADCQNPLLVIIENGTMMSVDAQGLAYLNETP